ncbi:glycosyltransferase family 2 protein [Candidatus Woesearchaeota archaeon]|nr:glycosyltransferase family 2 protein [Candidatus Woesearchaeota archaeon]
MISIVITSFNEAEIVGKSIKSILENEIKEEFELIVVAPDKATEEVVKQISKEYKEIKYFKDPGKGKSYALNLVFKILKGRIWIFTDGDTCVSKNAIKEIVEKFKDKSVGCVTGRPVSLNKKNKILGFWSHLLFDAGAHNIRKELDKKNRFLECSGYLFAFKNNITRNVPLNVAEDTIIPYLVTKKGYRIRYAEKALVYVQNPTLLKDFIKQRVRTAKAHETLERYAPFFPKVKSFTNEVRKGTLWALQYPKNIKEYIWTLFLFFIRLYIWILVKVEHYIFKKEYGDGWERVETTKLLR